MPSAIRRLRRERSDVADLARQDGEQSREGNEEELAVLRHATDATYLRRRCPITASVTSGTPITSSLEVSERLVGSPAFKAGGMGDPCPAGSIPVHLRHPLSHPGASRRSSGLGVDVKWPVAFRPVRAQKPECRARRPAFGTSCSRRKSNHQPRTQLRTHRRWRSVPPHRSRWCGTPA